MFKIKRSKDQKSGLAFVSKVKSKPKLTQFYLASVVALFVLTLGYGGFNYWKAHDLKAKADTYKTIYSYGSSSYGKIGVCKQFVNTAYGPYYKMKAIFVRDISGKFQVPSYSKLSVKNNSVTVSSKTNYYWYLGVTNSLDVLVAASGGQYASAGFYFSNGSAMVPPISFYTASTPNC